MDEMWVIDKVEPRRTASRLPRLHVTDDPKTASSMPPGKS